MAEDEASALRDLRARIEKLEERLSALEGRPSPAAAPPAKSESLETGFGLTFINRIGAVTLAIGIILFFKYAVDFEGIGPEAQLALGLLLGLALSGAGEWLRRRNQAVFAQGLAGCGLATVYIVFYAAYAYYHLLGLVAAVVLLAIVCGAAFVFVLRFENVFLAPWNAFVALLAAAALVNKEYPWWFVCFALALGSAYFTLNRQASKTFYLLGHACVLVAGVRGLDLVVRPFTSPLNRASVLNESYSIVLALYGIAVIVFGVWRRSAVDRLLGLTLLGLVIAKLYLYDVWLSTRLYRISAFVVLGILLLGSSYLYSRYRDKFEVLLGGKDDAV
jgi:uncharacterized membrane protein